MVATGIRGLVSDLAVVFVEGAVTFWFRTIDRGGGERGATYRRIWVVAVLSKLELELELGLGLELMLMLMPVSVPDLIHRDQGSWAWMQAPCVAYTTQNRHYWRFLSASTNADVFSMPGKPQG